MMNGEIQFVNFFILSIFIAQINTYLLSSCNVLDQNAYLQDKQYIFTL